MIRKPFALVLAATALGLAACGGSSSKSTTSGAASTVAAVQSTPSPSTPSTSTNSTRPADKPKAHKPSPAKPTVQQMAAANVKRQKTKPAVATPAPLTGSVTGPSPISCLRSAGLVDAHSSEAFVWTATYPVNRGSLFIEGPYRSAGDAGRSARSLQGVETEVQGGLYVVSAVLSAHLGPQANTVASCLRAVTGHGTLTY